MERLGGGEPTDGGRKYTFDTWTVARGDWRMIAYQRRDGNSLAVRVVDPTGWVEANLDEGGAPHLSSSSLAWGVNGEPLPLPEARALLQRAGLLRGVSAPATPDPAAPAPAASAAPAPAAPALPVTMADLSAKFGKKTAKK